MQLVGRLLLWRVTCYEASAMRHKLMSASEMPSSLCLWSSFTFCFNRQYLHLFIAYCGFGLFISTSIWNIVHFHSALDFIIFIFFVNFTLEKQTCLHGCFCLEFYAFMNFLFMNKCLHWNMSLHASCVCAHWFPFSSVCCSSLWLLKVMGMMMSLPSWSIWQLSVITAEMSILTSGLK